MRYNYKYGQIKDNQLYYAPNIIVVGDKQIINASAENYLTQGYLPIVKTEPPEVNESFYYIPTYTEKNNQIIQVWEEIEHDKELI